MWVTFNNFVQEVVGTIEEYAKGLLTEEEDAKMQADLNKQRQQLKEKNATPATQSQAETDQEQAEVRVLVNIFLLYNYLTF